MNNKLSITVGLISVALALCVMGIGVFMVFFGEDSCPEFLTSHKWESCDSEISCTETISFHEDGGFAYFCACGSSVGDYDLYDSFEYDSEKRIITVKGDGECEIKVLYYDETSLFLQLDDGTFKYFINEDAIKISQEYDFVMEYLEKAQFYAVIKEEKKGYLTILPQHYSTDERDSYEGLEYHAPLANDAKIYNLYARIENGEESLEYEEISFEGAFETEDNSYVCAYTDFNEKGEITMVIIYGAIEIWE